MRLQFKGVSRLERKSLYAKPNTKLAQVNLKKWFHVSYLLNQILLHHVMSLITLPLLPGERLDKV